MSSFVDLRFLFATEVDQGSSVVMFRSTIKHFTDHRDTRDSLEPGNFERFRCNKLPACSTEYTADNSYESDISGSIFETRLLIKRVLHFFNCCEVCLSLDH